MNAIESCPKVEALSALVDGELDQAQRVALEAHAAACPLCQPMLAEFRQLRQDFAALPQPVLQFDLAARVESRIGAAAAPARPRPRPARWPWWRVVPATFGAALSLSAGVYLGGMLITGAPAVSQPVALQMAVFAVTPPGALCPAPQSCKPSGQ